MHLACCKCSRNIRYFCIILTPKNPQVLGYDGDGCKSEAGATAPLGDRALGEDSGGYSPVVESSQQGVGVMGTAGPHPQRDSASWESRRWQGEWQDPSQGPMSLRLGHLV